MIDAFKTARYDQNAGHDARYPWKDDHISWLHNVYDLVTSAAVKSQKRYTKILMDTLSMLFGICGIEEQSLRLAASETLNKIVKATYLTHITRIQMTAFNEMKKNGNVRSLKVALTLFSAICPHLQPLRCKPTIHSLAAVLVNIMKRNEESINECLRDFLVDIFRVFACHLVDRDVQLLFEAFLSLLPSTSATTRRMTSTGIAALVEFGRRPLVYGKWVLIRMMNLLAIEEIQNGTSCLLGVLQAIRNLIPVLFALGEEVETALPHTLYAFLITCVVYEGDHNVVTSTLEVFQVILQHVPQLPQFSQWLVRPSSDTFLIEPFVSGSRLLVSPSSDSDRLRGRSSPLQKAGDSSSEMTSLHDDYFSSSRESLEVLEPDDDGTEDLEDSTFTPNAGMEEEDAVIIDVVGEEPTAFSKPLSPSMLPVSSPMPSSSPLPRSPNSSFSVVSGAVISTEVVKGSAHKVSWNEDLNLYVNLSACFVVASGNKAQSESINDSLSVPIVHLTQLLGYCFLDSKDQSPVRVSVRSLALSCLMHSVSLYPGALLCVGLPVGEGGRCYGRLPEGSSVFGGRLLDVVKTYSDNSDPKLRGHVATVIGAYLRSSLHLSLGRYTHFASKWTQDDLKAEDLIEHLVKLSTDESHLVLRSLCTAAIDCLPLLFQSGFAESALRLFTALLQLKKSTYWLVKVALVQLLSSVNYAHVCAAEYIVHSRGGHRQEEALETVFELLGSDDQRVRDIAAEGLAKLVPNLCFGESEAAVLNQVAQVEATSQFPRTVGSSSQLPGSGGGGQPKHTQAQISIVLDRIVNVILATSNQHQMLGCVGGLNHLAHLYPPLLNQDAWKCGSKLSHGWLTLLIPTITSSWLTHNLQGHAELMDFVSHLLSGVALKDVREKPSEGRDFTALKTDRLAKMMNELFVHLMKVLNVFAHVIESKEADQKLPKPYWELSKSTASSPAKSSPSSKEKPSDKSRKFGIVIRTDTLSKEVGHYRSQLHYIKLLEGIRSAYSNYQLNLDFEGSDKFSFLLSSVLNCLSAILEVSTFQDIAKHTEEIMGYIHITVQVDPRGSLLCTQQLLNALFGLNAAVHRMNIVSSTLYSPVEPFLFLSRTHTSQSVSDISRHSSSSLYGLCITDPFERMSSIIATAMPPGAAEDTKRRSKAKGSREETDGLLSKWVESSETSYTKLPKWRKPLHKRLVLWVRICTYVDRYAVKSSE
jgi:huntingtin